MFGKIMYYDKRTIDEYSAIMNGKPTLEIGEYKVSNDKGISANLKLVSGDAKASKEYTAKVIESILYDCAEFEKRLLERDDYFDFTRSSNYDISTIERGCIVKFDSFGYIPEGFDMLQLIDRFKPLLMGSLNTNDMDATGAEALKAFLGAAKATKIPLVFELDEGLLVAKINQENLTCDFEEIEEFEEQQITVLARISSSIIQPSKAYYDPLKDFMALNRMMRKSIKDRGDALQPLFLDQEYRQLDVLAIYR